ncbi:uncharacterized protein [Nicotiana sylvestris]|uniref:uncharacterized protein n=1 Tax=Nicotiana sylvestris TaxID=4096 RepID=UPI00388C709C
MKVHDYSIIEQLRKTPAQISLLSLLLHSKEHARVLIKTLNEAHVLEKTTMNELEKMANRFFEVNRISFTDDELPEEGAGHNRALHLVVKCEGHYVKRVMVDGGSSVDVCPLSTLQGMKINTDRIRPNNVRIRAFGGSTRDTIGEINLNMTIVPVDFEIVFQVVDMDTSYNFLLGRPWIHMARAVPSTLHQMVKFEHNMQEIIVHGEDESSIYKDPLIPCIEAKEWCESIVYQAFEVVSVDHVEEGKPILHPRLSTTSIMVAAVMMRQGYEPGKGLGESLQGISEPISPFGNRGTFGLGFRPTQADKNKSKHRKKHGWVLQQPIPPIFYTFVKPRLRKGQNSSAHANIDEICHGLSQMFFEVNMIQAGEGTSRANMQLIDPNTMLTNWEATPLPTRKESCFVNAVFNNMTCMRNSCPDLKKMSNIEIMHQEVEYDEDEVVEEIKRELEQFENKPKPNLNETEPINIGSLEEIREMKISIHTEQKTRDALIQLLFEYRDVFAWYDLKLNPAKCAFGVPSGKLLGFIVNRRGIELDPSKIKPIRDLPPPKNKKEVMSLLRRLNYISRFISQLTTTCEPIFKLLKKDAAIKWTDDCQKAFDRIKDYLSKPLVLVPSEPDHLAENPVDDEYKPLSTYFPDEEVNPIEEVVSDDHPIWKMYSDGAVNIKGVGIGTILISPIGHHYPTTTRLQFFCTNNTAEYEAFIMSLKMAIDLDVHELLVMGDSDLIIRQAQGNTHVDPLEIQVRNQHGYCNTIETEPDGEPWYHDIKRFLKTREYPEHAKGDQKRTIRRLANGFFLNGEILYKRTPDLNLLRCIGCTKAERIMREVHSGIHGDLIHSPPSELHPMSSPWPFVAWGMNVIGPIVPKASNGHRFILVAIDYFTKWVEAVTFKAVTKKAVVDFVHSNIICRFGIPKTIITDNATNLNSHLMKEV